jgi:hypothetical protein
VDIRIIATEMNKHKASGAEVTRDMKQTVEPIGMQ